MGLKDILNAAVGAVPGGGAVKAAVSVLSRFVSTPEDKQALAEIADRAAKREHDLSEAQIEVNKTEAAHRSLFVAGWRPFIGWGLGSGLTAMFWACAWRVWTGTEIPDLAPLVPFTTILTGMLGLNAMLRSRDKRLGTAR